MRDIGRVETSEIYRRCIPVYIAGSSRRNVAGWFALIFWGLRILPDYLSKIFKRRVEGVMDRGDVNLLES